ncbi:MAG: response regulator, partial [Gammaproteobacteria bacterium]
GLAALDALAADDFDLVLMDFEMPELDGLETTRRWRARERELGRAPLPVIALTANASEEDRRAALGAGMNDFLSKPFTAARLAATMRETLGVG